MKKELTMRCSSIWLAIMVYALSLASCKDEPEPSTAPAPAEAGTVDESPVDLPPTSNDVPGPAPAVVDPAANQNPSPSGSPTDSPVPVTGPEPSLVEEPEVVSGLIRAWDSQDLMFEGAAWSDSAGDVDGECMESRNFVYTPLAGGNRVRFTIKEVNDSRELDAALGIPPFLSFDPRNGDGVSKLAREAELDGYSVNVLLRASIKTSIGDVRDPKLKEYWLKMLQSDPRGFREVCGDGFISGSVKGKELLVLLQYAAQSQNEREQIRASLEGKTGTYRSAEAFRTAVEQIMQQNQGKARSIHTMRNGGVGIVFPDGSLSDWMADFTTNNADNPDTDLLLLAVISDYRSLPGLPADIHFIDPKPWEEAILLIADTHYRSHRIQSAFRYIIHNPGQFENPKVPELQSVLMRLEWQDIGLCSAASQCGWDGNCTLSTDLDVPSVALPAQRL